jgi:uncharacterized protein YkwD
VRSRFLIPVVAAVLTAGLAAPAQAAGSFRLQQTVLDEVNRVRSAHRLALLRTDPVLERAAHSHSVDMLRRGYFGHGAFAQRLSRFGARGPRLGENLAWGAGSAAEVRYIVGRWLASPPHRANLLRPGFRRIGVGAVVGNFSGYDSARVVTADFAGS